MGPECTIGRGCRTVPVPAVKHGSKGRPALVIVSYIRPETLEDALDHLAAPDARPLAGGTWLVAQRTDQAIEAVDLQSLPLAGIAAELGSIRIGATTTLQDIVDAPDVPPTLADLARREAPRSIRNAATIGGTIALADPESELLAGLLAYGATVSIAGTTSQARLALDQVFDNLAALDDGLITDVSFPTTGHAAADRTGRTPADRPIVAAVAHRDPGGTRLALTGVASRPILVDADAIGDLEPPADFRGSSDYRRQLARILSARVVTSVEVAR